MEYCSGRPLHPDRDFHRRLVDRVVVAKSLKAVGQHLDPQLAIRHAIETGFAVGVSLYLQAAFCCFPFFSTGCITTLALRTGLPL